MKRKTFAMIRFADTLMKRPAGHFLAQAKFPSDADTNPVGKWSLAVEPIVDFAGSTVPSSLPAFVMFVADEAPTDLLKHGETIELFYGFDRIGTALIAEEAMAPAERPKTEQTFRGWEDAA